MSQQLGIIHKTHDNARIVDGDSSPARANAEQAWWEWVTEHVGHRLRAYSEGLSEEIGEAMAEYVGQMLTPSSASSICCGGSSLCCARKWG